MDIKKIQEILNGTYENDCINAFDITHYRYQDCPECDLTKVPTCLYCANTNKGIYIHPDCLNAFIKMAEAALKDNIQLSIESAYRSSKYQIEVFKRKLDNPNTPSDISLAARLKFSAPAGYSEHHTGLAIDICSTENDFADSIEYKWLLNNADKYGFELSFPKNNNQNLGFEPWHWRYVGSDTAIKVFNKARKHLPN